MVNASETLGIDPAAGHPERGLALGYAPAERRPALLALFALDATLGKFARHTRDPLVAQMRLTWWHEALAGLNVRAVPGQPILAALAPEVAAGRLDPALLTGMVEGWEALLEGDPLDHARQRGAALFAAAAAVLGVPETQVQAAAGEGWALADLALHTPDVTVAEQARGAAAPLLTRAGAQRWRPSERPLGALALIARADLAGTPAGSPARVLALLRLRLTGR